ncbi:huntingtin-interacting protein K-like [Mytilus galloprovincialis]|uniref:Nascent polypeptide-associated complex subunit alpha-like UBA domain-containing protein n=1 Tax=Mytilus galloprovincialis TaxID=29158 RepID=A0A8B6DV99_MYTGA|nr:Hypothetical predicted protein [Mytilus galloprovincialis]
MTTEEEQVEEPDQEDDSKKDKSKKHDSGAADLEKVTDFVEETEISAQSIGDAMNKLTEKKTKERAEFIAREKELSKIKISKEDVDLIVLEMEIGRSLAERKLREHKGDIVEALVELTN